MDQQLQGTAPALDTSFLPHYYARLNGELLLLKRREDLVFAITTIVLTVFGLHGAALSTFQGFIGTCLAVAAIVLFAFGMLRLLRETAIFKGELALVIQELEARAELPKAQNAHTAEYWREDYYQLFLKLLAAAAIVAVVLR